MKSFRLAAGVASAVFMAGAHAAELPDSSRAEIEALIRGLGASRCEFYRNGHWYGGPEAAGHLRRKFAYLSERGMIDSTEDFIAKGATRSSFSGLPYKVRCDGGEPQTSSQWFADELRAARAGGSGDPLPSGGPGH